SMTGASKLEALRILARLEGRLRGIYAGSFGYLGFDGRLDLAMVIRTIVIDGAGATVGAGGGITALSVPHEELAEVKLKAAALLRVLLERDGQAATSVSERRRRVLACILDTWHWGVRSRRASATVTRPCRTASGAGQIASHRASRRRMPSRAMPTSRSAVASCFRSWGSRLILRSRWRRRWSRA